MLHKIILKIVFCISLGFAPILLIAQSFTAEDLIKAYTSHSDSTKLLCFTKNYSLKDSTFINNVKDYIFESSTPDKLRFTASFPGDNESSATSVNYWLKKKSELKNLKKSFTNFGFEFVGSKDLHTPGNTVMDRYIKDNIQIEIISSTANPPYWIIVHSKGKYVW